MITETGYSKDMSIMPEGIIVTFAQSMMKEQGGMRYFLKNFLEVMDPYNDDYWMHKCSNGPKIDVPHVYIIVANRLWGRWLYSRWKRAGNNMETVNPSRSS